MSNEVKYKKIDLTNWTCFSDRFNSKSYVSADKKWMVKFDSGMSYYDETIIDREHDVALKALALGVKTPKVGDIVIDDEGRKGLVYEYIEGKKSIARYVSEDLDNIDMYMKKFALVAREFHSVKCDTTQFESMHDRVINQINTRDILYEEQKVKAFKFLETIELKTVCAHGDFQTGNVILAGDKSYVIDLNSMGYGNPEFDIAMFYFFCFLFPKKFIDTVFHCEQKYLPIMWNSFIKYYYEANSEKSINEITERIKKVASLCLYTNMQFVKFDESKAPFMRSLIDEFL